MLMAGVYKESTDNVLKKGGFKDRELVEHHGPERAAHDMIDLIKKIKSNTPFILSGGLTLDNAMEGVKTVNPLAIDVNSGVEESPGEKDHDKIESLFRAFGYSNSNIFKEMIGKNV